MKSDLMLLKILSVYHSSQKMWLLCILIPHSPAEIQIRHYISTGPSFKLTAFIQWQWFINWALIFWIHSRWKIEVILFLPRGGTSLPIWKQLDRERRNHLPAIFIYMSYSRGLLLLESEEHFPLTELKFNHQTTTLQQNDAIHRTSGTITQGFHKLYLLLCSCTYKWPRLSFFCIENFSI